MQQKKKYDYKKLKLNDDHDYTSDDYDYTSDQEEDAKLKQVDETKIRI